MTLVKALWIQNLTTSIIILVIKKKKKLNGVAVPLQNGLIENNSTSEFFPLLSTQRNTILTSEANWGGRKRNPFNFMYWGSCGSVDAQGREDY